VKTAADKKLVNAYRTSKSKFPRFR
jgi:hypothetical protein